MLKDVLAAMFGLGAAAIAQNTLLVDPSNPAAYATLTSAVAAAQDGDIIRIAASAVLIDAPPLIDKALRIIGQGSALRGAMQVSIPAGKEFTLQGCSLGLPAFHAFPTIATFADCAGRVTLIDCAPPGWGYGFGTLRIRDCAQVLLSGCGMLGDEAPGLEVLRSTVSLERCTLLGQDGDYEQSYAAREGLLLSSAQVQCVDCAIHGGNQGVRLGGVVPGTLAVACSLSSLTIAGPATSIASGTGYAGVPIALNASTMTLAPEVIAAWTGGTVTVQAVPTILPTNMVLGQTGTLQLRSPSGTFGAILVGQPGDRATLPGVGDFWLDPHATCTAVLGIQGTANNLTWTIAIPNAAAFAASQFRWQGVTFDGVTLRASPPGATMLR